MLNCAVIGLGGLGKLHLNNLLSLEDDVKLVALCDVEPDKLSKAQDTNQGVQETKVDLSHINFYTDAVMQYLRNVFTEAWRCRCA